VSASTWAKAFSPENSLTASTESGADLEAVDGLETSSFLEQEGKRKRVLRMAARNLFTLLI